MWFLMQRFAKLIQRTYIYTEKFISVSLKNIFLKLSNNICYLNFCSFFFKNCRANTCTYVETHLIILRRRTELPSFVFCKITCLDQFYFLGWFSQLHAKRPKSYFILYKYVYKTNCFIFNRFRIIIRYKYVYHHTFSIQFFPLSIHYE